MKNKIIVLSILILIFSLMLFSCDTEKELDELTVTFNSNGGESVENQKVEIGGYIEEPFEPSKDGYTFEGWYNGDKKWDFSGIIRKDITLTAKWKPIEYSIKYVNGSCSLTSYFTNQEYDLTKYLWTTSTQYMVVEGWYFDRELTQPALKIEEGTFGNLTLYAKLAYTPITYSLSSDKEYTITGCDEGITELVIPATINGHPVKHIASHAFDRNRSLTKIVIENGLTSIGNYAFHDCSLLESIVIPDSVEEIGNYAFSLCASLKEFKLPASVTGLGNGAFFGCSSIKRVELNNIITVVSDGAFKGCSSLEYIDLGKSVISIESGAFSGCSSLSEIIYPSSIESIGDHAFLDCSNLKSIVLTDKITKIRQGTYHSCTSITELVLGENITQIDQNAFENCTSLTRVTLGKNVSSIGDVCFRGCTQLREFNIAYFKDLTLGFSVFENCTSLKSIILPKNVISIGSYAFKGCEGITINCEASTRPHLWDATWSFECDCTIKFGYIIEDSPDDNVNLEEDE